MWVGHLGILGARLVQGAGPHLHSKALQGQAVAMLDPALQDPNGCPG